MNFIVYDLILLGVFVLFVFIFIARKRKNLKREGLLLLYPTKWGIKLINRIGKKYEKVLNVLSYVSITLGFILMGGVFYMLGRIVWIYLFHQNIVRMIKIPPIMPLLPYLPQVFKLDFLPPLYFTYWIVIIAVIAITHEFSHGIFAAKNKIRIKKTGFGFFPFFLPIFLLAFVELDEKLMAKKEKIKQMAILSAGTFANVLTAVLFFFVLWAFFALSFVQAGITFDTYSYSLFPVEKISMMNGVALENASYEYIVSVVNGTDIVLINDEVYDDGIVGFFQDKEGDYLIGIYDNSPAINAGLKGAITEINGIKTDSREKFVEELLKYKPGDTILITTKTENETLNFEITLEENRENKELPFLGIGFSETEKGGILSRISNLTYLIKKPHVYYEPKFLAGLFIYDLLWWLVLVSMSVALMNMLPVGIFDGGRFLYLAFLAVIKDETKAKKVARAVNYFILLIAVLLMILWGISFK